MGRKARCLLLMLSFFVVSVTALNVQATTTPFDINMTLSGFTSSQEAILNDAAAYWESVISGYQEDTTPFTLDIYAETSSIDGDGGTLGSGGPDYVMEFGGFVVATEGSMRYDIADIGSQEVNNELYDTVLHEIAHVMGFGTLWTDNGVYTDGTYRYTGAAALAAYQTEFGFPGATFVPVENDGGPGTADAHWESTSVLSNDMMVGWSSPSPTISQTTLASFVDIGYELKAVSVPGAIFLLASGLLGLIGLRKRYN